MNNVIALMLAAAIAVGVTSQADIWTDRPTPEPPPPATAIIPATALEPVTPPVHVGPCLEVTIVDGVAVEMVWTDDQAPRSYTEQSNRFRASIVGHYLWIDRGDGAVSIDITGVDDLVVCHGDF